MTASLFSWLLTYLAHSTAVGLMAGLALYGLRNDGLRETVIRCALFGAILTATLAPIFDGPSIGWPVTRSSAEASPLAPPQAPASDSPLDTSGVATAAVAAWLLIAGCLTARRLHGLAVLRASLARTRSEAVEVAIDAAAAPPSHRPPRVVLSDSVRSPFASIRSVYLPIGFYHQLDPAQRLALIRHETAHLVRGDALWFVLATLVESVFFFQPLHRWQRRQLIETAEYRCDRWAIEQGSRQLDLAEVLVRLGRVLEPHPTGARAEGGRVAERVRRLVSWKRQPPASARLHLATALALLSTVLAAVPRLAVATGGREEWVVWSTEVALVGETSSSSDKRTGTGTRLTGLLANRAYRQSSNEIVVWVRSLDDQPIAAGFQTAGARSRRIPTRAIDQITWQGRLTNGESLETVRRFWESAPTAEVRGELGAVAAIHADFELSSAASRRLLAGERAISVRSELVSWLGRRNGVPEGASELERIARADSRLEVQLEAVDSLARLGCPACVAGLRSLGKDHPSVEVRDEALEKVARFTAPSPARRLDRSAQVGPASSRSAVL